jgi:hypothetical protein
MNKDISSINEDLKYIKAGWPLRTGFWILVLVFLTYGLSGGFGDGSLSKGTVRISGAVIKYEKYLRVDKSIEMKIMLDDTVRNFSIAINSDYINSVYVSQIIPEPVRSELEDDKIIYHFASSHHGTITFLKDPARMGLQPLNLEVNGEKVSLSQYIYF